MITETLKPNIAIVTDVCHDTSTPMIDVKKQGDNVIIMVLLYHTLLQYKIIWEKE